MRKREPEELVGLPGFAGRMNKRVFVDFVFYLLEIIDCLFTPEVGAYMRDLAVARTDSIQRDLYVIIINVFGIYLHWCLTLYIYKPRGRTRHREL